MEKKLRKYQQEDVKKLENISNPAILNQQRTGKTPTALKLLEKKGINKFIIVAPKSMLYKWRKECLDWIKKDCIVIDGTKKQRLKQYEQWTQGAVVSFDTLKLVNRKNKKTGKKEKTGDLMDVLQQKPEAILVDEFHRARNKGTTRAKSLYYARRHIKLPIPITGTPTYSSENDLFSLVHFMEPKAFPTWTDFTNRFYTFKQIYTHSGRTVVPDVMHKAGKEYLKMYLNKHAVQRKQSDPEVMPWLPKKPLPEVIQLPKSKLQEQAIKELEEYFETADIMAQGTLDRIMLYRQILFDPRAVIPRAKKKDSPKALWLDDYLKDCEELESGRPTLFFSNFTSILKILQKDVPNSALIIGETSLKEAERIAEDFQKRKIKHLFINTQVGKEGLTLDRAEAIVLFEMFPPAGDYEQLTERFTATCEENKDIPKAIYQILIEDSYDISLRNATELGLNSIQTFNYIKMSKEEQEKQKEEFLKLKAKTEGTDIEELKERYAHI